MAFFGAGCCRLQRWRYYCRHFVLLAAIDYGDGNNMIAGVFWGGTGGGVVVCGVGRA